MIFDNLKRNLVNIRGIRSKNKLVIIESDDWGSIRMPSKDVYNYLDKNNYKPDMDPYLKYDSLAGKDDFGALFDVLKKVKDKNGNPAIITANAVMGNPDFKKIKESNFNNYYWEPFYKTWEKYKHCDGVEEYWKNGQSENLIKFQCHGREHLNVSRWMKDLKTNEVLKTAFELEMISISSISNNLRFGYMEGLDFFSKEEQLEKKEVIEEGLNYFRDYFGFSSKSFIANCYIWDDLAEKVLSDNGVKYIQGISNQIKPILKEQIHSHQYVYHYMGQRNNNKQTYLVRNVFFEPSQDSKKDWVSDCLNRIEIAFRWGKPAIIGSHRLNFIGSIDEDNRTKNLKLLEELLKQIVKRWPDAEFTTSDEVMALI